MLSSDINPQISEGQYYLLRVVTYNIHKGVRGIGPTARAEYHNLAHAMTQFDADLIFLQEVRKLYHDKGADDKLRLTEPQAELFAPEGYVSSYMTNAYTKKGQHGNALLSKWPVDEMAREDISNNRFEQRGLLHVKVRIHEHKLHCIVVHLSLMQASRNWQQQKLLNLIRRDIPESDPVLIAGDFNDWNDKLLAPMQNAGFITFQVPPSPTFPSFAPMLRLDRIYARGLEPLSASVPKGKIWTRMSDHLPLIGEFKLKVL